MRKLEGHKNSSFYSICAGSRQDFTDHFLVGLHEAFSGDSWPTPCDCSKVHINQLDVRV